MLPYWLMFTLWTAGALQIERRRVDDVRKLFFVIATIVTGLMIGLRFEVGGDWGNYQRIYQNIAFMSLHQAIGSGDIGYTVINWLAAQGTLGIVFVNSVCALLFMGGFARLAWRQPNPALAVLVAVPYLIIVVAMGYTRQAAAIGVICLAIADGSERRLLRLTILIVIAALFHKTAILVLPIALVPVFRRSAIFGVFGVLMFVVLFVLLLRDTAGQMMTSYVQGDYDSQGAAVRIFMNVVAASIFLFLRKNIVMPNFQKSFWTACSILSLLSVFAFLTFSASSGIDRLSLYLIPLQAITYSRLPYILSHDRRAVPSIIIGVIGYSFFVQFVWLNYADNVEYWLPYSMSLYQAAQ